MTVNRYAIIVFWSEDDRAWVADGFEVLRGIRQYA